MIEIEFAGEGIEHGPKVLFKTRAPRPCPRSPLTFQYYRVLVSFEIIRFWYKHRGLVKTGWSKRAGQNGHAVAVPLLAHELVGDIIPVGGK